MGMTKWGPVRTRGVYEELGASACRFPNLEHQAQLPPKHFVTASVLPMLINGHKMHGRQ